MSERITVGGILVDKVLYDFVNDQAIPGTGIDPDAFWAGASEIFTDLAPRNRELLDKRDELQTRIDTWHHENPAPIDPVAYKAFLQEIGYLVPELNSVAVNTENVDEEIATVTADGAYDTRRCHSAIIARKATAIIPIRKNGRPWKEDCPAAIARNETLRATRHYGRAFWKRWTGYHVRSRIEAKMRCLKAFGERIAARDPDRQTAEIQIRVALMNRFSALGTAEIIRAA